MDRRWSGRVKCAIALTGELDMQSSARFRAEVSAILREQPVPTSIEVDLAGVTFVDSLGLGTLVVAQRICAELDVRLTVANPTAQVARLLEVSGMAAHLADPG
jgi:anti-anti-sigma factor